MKKLLCSLLCCSALSVFAQTEQTKSYLPMTENGPILTFSTEDIPNGLSVTVKCLLPKKNGRNAKNDSFIYVSPHSNQFSSIQSFSRNNPIELGGKIYSRSSIADSAFSFKINGVTRDNKAIIIDTRRQGKNALTGECYY